MRSCNFAGMFCRRSRFFKTYNHLSNRVVSCSTVLAGPGQAETIMKINWRMTEIQSVIGRLQLQKLDKWVEARRANAARFNAAFASLPALRLTVPPAEIYHSYYKYYMFVRPELLKPDWSRDRIMEEVNAPGIPCFSGSCSEIYLEKAFDVFRGKDSEGLVL
ncbi:MAG: DegT/DnrJ/EryC1/StrS aminotransferase family protein [Erysipelotrichia bacterium]|nr:DegT/DnrJ/EryC1/StrS aminotransferase family protein [Erysipelotrichia bacterium]